MLFSSLPLSCIAEVPLDQRQKMTADFRFLFQVKRVKIELSKERERERVEKFLRTEKKTRARHLLQIIFIPFVVSNN